MKTKLFSTILLSLVVTTGLFAQSQEQTNSSAALERIAQLMAKGYSFYNDFNKGLRDFHEGMVIVKYNNKYGFVNNEGRIVVPCIYDRVFDFSFGIAFVGKNIILHGDTIVREDGTLYISEPKKETTWGVINKTGKQIVPFCERCSRHKYNPNWIVTKNAIINSKGEYVLRIPDEYREFRCIGDAIEVQKDSQRALMDIHGNIVCPFGKYFLYREPVLNGKYILVNDAESHKDGIINTSGKIIIPCEYDYIKPCYGGNVWILSRKVNSGPSKYKVAINGGTTILPTEYDEGYSGKSPKVRKNGKTYYILPSGKILSESNIPGIKIEKYENGVYEIRKKTPQGEKHALMDSDGKVISSYYDHLYLCKNGYAVVINKGKGCGLIDNKGKVIAPLQYGDIDDFPNSNHALNLFRVTNELVKTEGQCSIDGVIDGQGNIVVPIKYDRCLGQGFELGRDGTFKIFNNEKKGLLSSEGKELLPCIYEDIYLNEDGSGFIAVKKDGKWGYADREGHTTFDYKFDSKQLEQDNSESSDENKNVDKEDKKQDKKKKKSKFMNFLKNVLEEGKKTQE